MLGTPHPLGHSQFHVPPPRLRVIEQGRKGALGVGDRILARTEERGSGHVAHPMKRLAASAETVIGVLVEDVGPGGKPMIWLRPAAKRARYDFAVADKGDANIEIGRASCRERVCQYG